MTCRVPAEVCGGQPSQTESSPWGPRILGPPSQTGLTWGSLCPTSCQPSPLGRPLLSLTLALPTLTTCSRQPRCPHLLPRDRVSAITTLTRLSPGFSMLWEIILGGPHPARAHCHPFSEGSVRSRQRGAREDHRKRDLMALGSSPFPPLPSAPEATGAQRGAGQLEGGERPLPHPQAGGT